MNQAAASPQADPADPRPVVRTGNAGNLGLWVFALIALAAGLLVFQMVNARREDLAAGAIAPGTAGGLITAPPPLSLPQQYGEPYPAPRETPFVVTRLPAVRPAAPPQPAVVTRVIERPAATLPSESAVLQPRPAYVPLPATTIVPQAPAASTGSTAPSERVTASRLANPSLTVPQGTVIAAVLETALDSTRAGAVRAMVSRDVKSFDGSRVLIPRGSRLYGEYNADVTSGQKRALIRWQRLTRPDAVIVNLDSPAADPLGRAGVAGKVDSHFFARFGSAILQSVLDIGVGIATRSVTDDAVILALPGSTQQITGQQQSSQVQPTLRVQQGTSVSVFVARDVDFSTVER